MRTMTFLLATLFATWAQAQSVPRSFTSMPSDSARVHATVRDSVHPGTVTIIENGQVTALMADYASRERSLKGFRIQVFLGDRASAENTRRSFLLKHPDTPAYLSYLAPNFRVRVGDLRDRVAAEKLLEDLRTEFPGSYVVPDDIELPSLLGQ